MRYKWKILMNFGIWRFAGACNFRAVHVLHVSIHSAEPRLRNDTKILCALQCVGAKKKHFCFFFQNHHVYSVILKNSVKDIV